MANIKLSDLRPGFEEMFKEEYYKRQLDKSLAFASMFPPSPPDPWHVRIYKTVRYWLVSARVRLGEIIAGQRFGDE